MTLIAQANSIGNSMPLIEIIPVVRMLSVFDKLRLIRMLAEEHENSKDIFPLEFGKTYSMSTPYNMFGVAEILFEPK